MGKDYAYGVKKSGNSMAGRRKTHSEERWHCFECSFYPLQYSWASLVAQLVKNPPAVQETWV